MARRQAPTAPLAVLLVTLLLALLQAPQALAQAREVLHMGGDGETEAGMAPAPLRRRNFARHSSAEKEGKVSSSARRWLQRMTFEACVEEGCLPDQVEACRMDCPVQYQDPRRYLCPCYSKLGQCLVRIGCSMKQRVDVAAFCSRRGYCKDGYCNFRAGDLTPRGDMRPEVFELTSVKTPGTPCIDNCCPPPAEFTGKRSHCSHLESELRL
ncbi:hypothetical protein GQ600_23006 [Phytophthora cactorum]|nr:hypothetical protein GQ600_23006 [Phytophthora cactorum]